MMDARQVEAARELKTRRIARTSLVPYMKYTYPLYHNNWHHDLIAEYLEKVCTGEIDRLMVFTPPRHGKSEEVTVRFNGFYLGQHPDHSIIGCSYAQDLARTFSKATRNILQGPYYQKLFPLTLTGEADTHWQVEGRSDERPSYIAAGVGGPISGQGAHLLNIDDPVKNAEEADSPVVRESQWNWWTSTARTRVMPGGRIVFTMTRWHEDDLAGRLIRQALADKKADQWTIICLPATNDTGTEAYIWNTRDGETTRGDKKIRNGAKYFPPYEALWPDQYPRFELDRIQASTSPRWWNALYQQRPSALAGGIIMRDWISRYRLAELPTIWDSMTQSWDMAFKDKKDNSFVCGQVWAHFRTRDYLLDQWREHAGFAKSCKAVRDMTAKWPRAFIKLVEDKANGPAIMETLRDDLGGFVEIEPQGSKPARLEACSPRYMSHSVVHPSPEEQPWILGVEEELFNAPNIANWDQADCVSQYLNWKKMKAVGPIEGVLPSQSRQAHSYLGAY